MRLVYSFCLATILLRIATVHAQTFEGIGNFVPNDLSADGSVVVGNQNFSNAVRWENNELTELGTSDAIAISDDGLVSVGRDRQTGRIWTEAGGEEIAPPWGQIEGWALAVNGDGSVIFGNAIAPSEPDTGSVAYRYENGSFTLYSIQNYTGITESSADGSIFAGSTGQFVEGPFQAVVWVDDNPTLLGSESSSVVDISTDGSLILVNDLTGAFLYDVSTGSQTPVLTRATSMNGDGSIVVGNSGGFPTSAMLWTPDKGSRNFLQALQEDHGVDTAGWDINPYSILVSDDGSVMVGRTDDGTAWRLQLKQAIEIVVNSTADRPRAENAESCETGETLENGDPECTLRSAIQAVNAGVGNTITFNIEGESIPEISPDSPLPVLTTEVTIDGSSQPGNDFVRIRGSSTGEGANGLSVNGATATLRGLIITEFNGSGIHIDGGSGHIVEQCILGTDTLGTANLGNGTGLTVLNADNVTIGNNQEAPQTSSDDSSLPEKQADIRAITIGTGNLLNVISGNQNGVVVESSNDVSMHWNLLGTKPNGLEALANLQAAFKAKNVNGFLLGNTTRPSSILGSLLGGQLENVTNSIFRKIHLNMDANGENAFPMIPKGLLFNNSISTEISGLLAGNITESGVEVTGGRDLDMKDFRIGTGLLGKVSFPVGMGLKLEQFAGLRLSKSQQNHNQINAKVGLFIKNLRAASTNLNPQQQSDGGVSTRISIGQNLISHLLLGLGIDGEEVLSTMDNGICMFDSDEVDMDEITIGEITDKAIQLDGLKNAKLSLMRIGTNLLGTKQFPVGYGVHAQNSNGILFGHSEKKSLIHAQIGMFLKNLKTHTETEVVPSNTRNGFTTRTISIGNGIQNLLINLGLDGESTLGDTTETGICLQNSCDFDMDNISMGKMTHGFLASDSEGLLLKRMFLGTNPAGTKIFPMTYGFHGTNLKGLIFGDPDRKSLVMAKTGLFLKNLKALSGTGQNNLSPLDDLSPRISVNIPGNKLLNTLFNLSMDGEESMAEDAETGICLQDSCEVELDNIFTGKMTHGIQLNNSALVNLQRLFLGSNFSGTKVFPLEYGLHASNSQGLTIGHPDHKSILNGFTGLFMKNIKAYQGDDTFPTSVRTDVGPRIGITIGNSVQNLLFNLDLTGEQSIAENIVNGICLQNACDFDMNNLFMGRMQKGLLANLSEKIRIRRIMMGLSMSGLNPFAMQTGIEATDCKGLNFGDPDQRSAIFANIGALFKNVKAYKETETVTNSLRGGTTTRILNLGNSMQNIVVGLGLDGKGLLGPLQSAFCFGDSCEVTVSKAVVGSTTGNAVEVTNSSIIEVTESIIGESLDGTEDYSIGGFGLMIDEQSEDIEVTENWFTNSDMGAVKVDGEAEQIVIRKNRMFDNIKSIERIFSSSMQEITGAFDGSTVVEGTVVGQPGETVIMDFYSQGPTQTIDAAEEYLGEQVVQLDENGMGQYTAVFKDITPEDWKVTTTVTDSTQGTSPLAPPVSLTEAPDSDMDGMPDYWENLFHCLDPNNPDDADEDCDVDGATNLQEYENRRVPTLDERQIGVGKFDIGDINSLTFGALDNFEYILECSLNLQPDSWVEVDRVVVEDGGEVTLSDPSPPAASKFYRIKGMSLP